MKYITDQPPHVIFLMAGRVCLMRSAALWRCRGRRQDGRAALHCGAAESGIEAAGGGDEAGWKGGEDGSLWL